MVTDIRRSPVVYEAVADVLRQGIQDGTYKPGDALPTINDLKGLFGVGRDCIRNALHVLEREGVVVPDGNRPMRVPATVKREVVVLAKGAVVSVRMASPADCEWLDVDAVVGVPVIVVSTPGQPDALYAANRVAIRAADQERQMSA